jgi:hypothetical protein
MAVLKRGEAPTPAEENTEWSERLIASCLGRQFFRSSYCVLVPNCNFTGHECDVLAVAGNGKIVDVEIKIRRADFKADAKKAKWWHRSLSTYDSKTRSYFRNEVPRQWPPKVWKHYFVMPASVWSPDLVESLPSPNCGVVTLSEDPRIGLTANCVRRAKANRDARAVTTADAIRLARLASLRMLDAFAALEGERRRSLQEAAA